MHTKELGKKIDIEISKYHLNKKQEKEVFECVMFKGGALTELPLEKIVKISVDEVLGRK